MGLLVRWVLPIAFVAIGIAVLFGWILRDLPPSSGLRLMIGVVVILLGVHRFVASRTASRDRRRFGGERDRPWEEK